MLGCSLDENLTICAESVRYLKGKGLETIFDAEHFFDGYKENPEYAMKVLTAAAEAGADALVLCDTNGGSLPEQVFEIMQRVCRTLGSVTIGIHTHNDCDCATANSLAAVRAGARHVQGTINGLGERCGNADLCAVIPSLAFKMGLDSLPPEKMRLLTETSRFVFEIGNLPPATNLPYVGSSAFAHKAGLHVDALRKSKQTYEHIDPKLVGNERRFLISELSGKSNILAELEKAKLTQDKTLARKILARVQELENEGYQFEAANASFDLLTRKVMGTFKPSFELIKYHVNVEKRKDGRDRHGSDRQAEGGRPGRARGRRRRRPGQRARRRPAPIAGDLLSGDPGDAPDRLQGPRRQRPGRDGGPRPRRHRVPGQAVRVGNGGRLREHHRGQLAGAGGQRRVQDPEVDVVKRCPADRQGSAPLDLVNKAETGGPRQAESSELADGTQAYIRAIGKAWAKPPALPLPPRATDS